jgi:hypothetical protein
LGHHHLVVVACACLTLAVMHLLVWCRMRTAWASLLFCLTALGVVGFASCELLMMRAETPGQFGIPFHALVDEHKQYLIERYSFTYLTSGRDGNANT